MTKKTTMTATAPKKDTVPSAESLGCPLYPLALGAEWHKLDAVLQRFHGTTAPRRGEGSFDIRHGRGLAARMLVWLFRLPDEGHAVPTKILVHCEPVPKRNHGVIEIWERTFGEHRLVTVQWINASNMLMERLGTIEVCFRLTADDGALCFEPVSAAFVLGRLRIKLPRWLSPQTTARVSGCPQSANGFAVSVKLVFPLIGFLLSYKGYLDIAETA